MTLTEGERSSLDNALRIAGETYAHDVIVCREAGFTRLADQFVSQLNTVNELRAKFVEEDL